MVDTCEETEIMMLKLIKKILCFAISAILMINIHSANGMIVLAEDNETIIYQYLRNELQLNEAGASGVLSNLFFESSFNPNASSPGGSYYGIVQWGGGRKTNLENYAASLGVDRSDLKAQLDFMKQELNMAYYRSVYNDLLSVDNTADGAAQAADIFKRRYEVASDPKDRTQKARDFFAKYYVAPTPTPSPVPTPVPSSTPTPSSTPEPAVNYTLQGQGHQSEIGWLSTVGDGQTIGNDTNNKNLEAAKLIIENALEADLRIVGDAHVSGIGWINNQEAGNTLGTVGAGRAIEGLRLRLAGRQASQYQIYYRAYAKGYGWLGWASSNELAGSIGHGVPVQAIQVKLVKNGESAPSPLGDSEVEFPYTYTVTGHQANVGWIPEVINDGVVGNVNTGNALEAFKITFLGSKPGDIGVQADAHVSTIGWINNQDASQVVGGTVGSGHALEGIRLRLVGNKANKYQIYYRAYAKGYGWLGWASSDEIAGSTDHGIPLQAVQVMIALKGTQQPSPLGDSEVEFPYTYTVTGHQANVGWIPEVINDGVVGNVNTGNALEAFKITFLGSKPGDIGVQADAHVSTIGWINNQDASQVVGGTVGSGHALEGIRLRLVGNKANKYQIYYRAYAKGYGWLGWARSDELAGSTDYGIPLQAVQVMITLKGTQQPSPLGNSSINRSVPTPTPTPSPVPTPVPSSTPTPSSTTEPVVNYTLQGQGHQSEIGWLSTVGDGQTIGNDTNNKNLEAAKLIIENALEADLRIVGDAHVSGIGWINNQEAGNTLGTVGAGRAIEGLRLRLAGRQASQYQIYYRAYAKGYGWLGWASSNELAGSIGHGVPVQAIQVKLVKNGESAPSPLGDSEVEFPYTYTVTGHQANVGWIPEVINDGVVGNVNTGNALEAFKITFLGSKPGDIGVQADAHVSTIGWINNQDASQVVGGTVGSGHALEGIRLRLVGNKANKYNLYYRVYIEQFGWLGWANANELAGSENLSLHIQGLQVKAVMKKYDDGSLANDQNESYVTEPKTGFASIIRNGRRMQVYFYNGQIVTWNFREGRNFYHVDPSTGEILTLQTTRSDSVWAEGIDISEHNYGINLADYQNGFVIIRIGYSTKEDKHWREYLRICEQLHIPYGVYLYSYALNDADAVEEAKFTLNILSQIHPTLGVWFDMEDADGYKQRHAPWILNKTTISSITRTYLDIVATSGHTVGIYASSSWFSNYIDVPGYPKWVANWGVNDGQWHNDFSNQAYMQQYTSFENLDRDLLFIDPNLIR